MQTRVLEEMIYYFRNDARRINHALKVHGFACAIAEAEDVPPRDTIVINYAAALHDIGIKEAERKHNSTSGKYQEMEGPPIAREILDKCGIETDISDRVCYLVGNHHSYSQIDGLDFQILVEADFLVNIFEDGMDRGAIESVKLKYFKTESGIKMLESMYVRF